MAELNENHVIYRMSDLQMPSNHQACGVDHDHDHGESFSNDFGSYSFPDFYKSLGTSRNRRTGFNGDATKTTCELSVYADYRYFISQGQTNVVVTTNNIIAFVSNVDQIFRV